MRGTQLNESSVYTSLLSLLLPQRRDARLERAVPFQPLDDGPLRPYYVGPELRLVALPLQVDLLGLAFLAFGQRRDLRVQPPQVVHVAPPRMFREGLGELEVHHPIRLVF